MSQLSQLYLDILEAISCLSMQKGTTQKEILNQIANQLGRPLTKKAVCIYINYFNYYVLNKGEIHYTGMKP